jgi:small subunit ribosomal protein S16
MSFKEESILKWMGRGAQLSETVRSLLKRAGILAKFRAQEGQSTAAAAESAGSALAEPPQSQ